jgi:hypothetical protein
MGFFRLLRRFSWLLGGQRDLVRRLGGIALVVMGVHTAADVLDDVAADVLDALDLVLDGTVASCLGWLSARGAVTPDAAVSAIEGFSSAIDLDEKQWLALRLALVVELAFDALLLDLCWGARQLAGPSRVDELRETTRQLRDSLRSLDLERLLAPWVLCGFAFSGAFVAGTAAEQLVTSALSGAASGLLVAGNVGAAVAVVVVALLVVRFVPDLVHGALVRAHARGERARQALATRRQRHPGRWPAVDSVVDEARRALRGVWLALALATTVAGLPFLDVEALLQRLQAAP